MNRKFFIGSVGEPGKGYDDENFDRCKKLKAHVMHQDTRQKGVFNQVGKGDIFLLKYKRQLVAYGEVISREISNDSELDGWTYIIRVNDWYFCSHDSSLVGVSKYGISDYVKEGAQMATIKEVDDIWGLQKVDEITHMSGTFNELFYKLHNENNMKQCLSIIENSRNLILQGAPGTGKTYNTTTLALSIIGEEYELKNLMDKYNKLRDNGQIEFVTFHQSMDYEDFIEGLKPSIENGNITYKVEDGVFKQICQKAIENPDKNFVLIIDEINRGNISKIFGELISLIEADKRIGNTNGHPLKARLPYSKIMFGVPFNLYVIGTMNTTDRSVGGVDYAIRRRFAFYTLKSDINIVENSYGNDEDKKEVVQLYGAVQNYILKERIEMDVEDLMVGHSYFMNRDNENIQQKWTFAILPLLIEYYKDGICKKSPEKDMKSFITKYGIDQ